MTIDISQNPLRNLTSEGGELSYGRLRTGKVTCLKTAQETMRHYNDDPSVNGIFFPTECISPGKGNQCEILSTHICPFIITEF